MNRRLSTYPISASNPATGTAMENTRSISDAITNNAGTAFARTLINAPKAAPLPFGTAPATPGYTDEVERRPEHAALDARLLELQAQGKTREAQVHMENRVVWAARGII